MLKDATESLSSIDSSLLLLFAELLVCLLSPSEMISAETIRRARSDMHHCSLNALSSKLLPCVWAISCKGSIATPSVLNASFVFNWPKLPFLRCKTFN